MVSQSSKTFQPSSKTNPCPVCDRTKDFDCRVIEFGNLIYCHTHQDGRKGDELNGYTFIKNDDRGAGWGVWAKLDKPIKSRPIKPESQQIFSYPDRDGAALIRVHRQKGSSPEFWQSYFIDGEWKSASKVDDAIKAEMRSRIPIYRYREVQQAIEQGKTIFWCEGELLVDALWRLGIPATTTIAGCKAYRHWGDYSNDLNGASIVVCPDRDQCGMEYAESVYEDHPSAQWLYAFPESMLWKCKLPKDGGLDVKDWIESGATLEEIVNAIEPHRGKMSDGAIKIKTTLQAMNSAASQDNGYTALRMAITDAMLHSDPLERELMLTRISSKFSVPTAFVRRIVTDISKRHDTTETSFSLQDLIDLGSEGTRWAIPRFLPKIGLTLLAGFAKDGKSTLMYEMVASLVTGRPFLGQTPEKKLRVLLIQVEENKYQIRDNLDAVNVLYDPDVLLSGRLMVKRQWAIDDLDTLEEWVIEHRADVVLIDSLRAVSKSIGTDENSQAFATPVYGLQERLSMLKISGYLIHHFNKSKDAGDLEKVAGNSAILGACDNIHTLLRVTKDPNDYVRQLNMKGRSCNGGFSIEMVDEFPKFHWVAHGESGVSAEEKGLKARILKAIELNQKSYPNGISATNLKEVLELKPGDRSISRPLKALVQEGMLATGRCAKDKRVCLYALPSQLDHTEDTPPPMPETQMCDQSLEPLVDKALNRSQDATQIDRSGDSVINFSSECDQSASGSNLDVESPLVILEDTTQRNAINQGGGVESPVISRGGFASYRTDVQPHGKRTPVMYALEVEHDGKIYRVADRVLWRGQQRQIERIEEGDTIRVHLGNNQWCNIADLIHANSTPKEEVMTVNPTQPEPIDTQDEWMSEESLIDSVQMMRDVIASNDPATAKAMQPTFALMSRNGKKAALDRLTQDERDTLKRLLQ